MKKILLIVLMFAFMATGLFAKVTIIEEGGKMVAVVTHSTTYNDYPQLNIIGSFMNWQKPGAPMYRNDKGEWEYKIVLDAPMVKYKFYDPRISDDSAYIDDTENDNKVANPFGSYDWLIKRPKKPSGGTGGAEEEDFAPVFGMWSRIYYNLQFMSDLGQKVVKDKDGNVVYAGTITGELLDGKTTASVDNWKSDYVKEYDAGTGSSKKAVVDGQVGFSWAAWRFAGENGTTKDAYTRVILGRDSLTVSNTLKFHGKVTKYFTADVEINAQCAYYNANERWVYANGADTDATKKLREEWWNNRMRSNVSNFVSSLFGGLGMDYVFAKQYYNNPDSSQSNTTQIDRAGTDYDAGSMHVDQVQFGWTTKDFDLNVAGAGGKSLYSKDPMALISGDRIGSTNYVQSNIIALIHPDKVKGLNVNFGTTYSGATKNYSGGGGVPKQDNPTYGYLDSEVGRYLFYTDINYNILGKYTIGGIYTMSSYVPNKIRIENFLKDWTGLDAFANATHQIALWSSLNPVEGLSMNVEAATELPTRFFNGLGYLEGNSLLGTSVEQTWTDLKVKRNGFDFIAQSAIYFDIGYSYKNMLNFKLFTANAGRLFRGNLAGYDSPFAAWTDIWAWDLQTFSRSHGQAIGNVTAGLDFAVSPITSDPGLLKITFKYDVLVEGLGSPEYMTTSLADIKGVTSVDESTTIDPRKTMKLKNRWKPGVESKFKAGNLNVGLKAEFDLTLETYMGQALIDGKVKDVSSNVFTLRGIKVGAEIDNISEVLKTAGIYYNLDMRNFGAPENGGPGANTTQETFNRYNNKWNWAIVYNSITADLRFKNDISFAASYLLRYTHGGINAAWESTTANAGNYVLPDNPTDAEKAAHYSIPDYWSWGLAFQVKYVIPVKQIKTPTLFCNLSLGWDPFQYFDPGYLETADLDTSRTDRGTAGDWSQPNIHSFQMSQLTVGLQWDF